MYVSRTLSSAIKSTGSARPIQSAATATTANPLPTEKGKTPLAPTTLLAVKLDFRPRPTYLLHLLVGRLRAAIWGRAGVRIWLTPRTFRHEVISLAHDQTISISLPAKKAPRVHYQAFSDYSLACTQQTFRLTCLLAAMLPPP